MVGKEMKECLFYVKDVSHKVLLCGVEIGERKRIHKFDTLELIFLERFPRLS